MECQIAAAFTGIELTDIPGQVAKFFAPFSVQETFLLAGAIWACVTGTLTIFDFSWGMFRRHGLPYWVFQLALGLAAVLILVHFTHVGLKLCWGIDVGHITSNLAIIAVILAALYVFNEIRERKSFSLVSFVNLFVSPLLPTGIAMIVRHAGH